MSRRPFTHTAFAALAVAALLTGAASLPSVAKETPPAGAPAKNFVVTTPTTYSLANGLKVTLIPYGKIPKSTVVLNIRSGELDEDGRIGIAAMTSSLLFEGAGGLSSADISRKAGSMGGEVGGGAGSETTNVSIAVLSEFTPQAVQLVADVAMRPTMDPKDLERLKNDRIRGLSIARSRPQAIAAEASATLIYNDHRYGVVLPTEEQIKAITIDQVKAFHKAQFTAAKAHVYVAGVFDEAATRKAVEAAFGGLPAGDKARIDPPTPNGKLQLKLIDRANAPQSTLVMAVPVPPRGHKDEVPLFVMNTLLGGSFGSRITQNIREDKGYTYSPGSGISARYQDSIWRMQADVTAANTGDSLFEIFKEIDRLRNEAPSEAELKAIKDYLSGTFVLGAASRNGIINQVAALELHGLPFSDFADYVKKVQAVTPADVARVAKTYIDPTKMSIVIVGDKASVRPQLDKVKELTPALPGL